MYFGINGIFCFCSHDIVLKFYRHICFLIMIMNYHSWDWKRFLCNNVAEGPCVHTRPCHRVNQILEVPSWSNINSISLQYEYFYSFIICNSGFGSFSHHSLNLGVSLRVFNKWCLFSITPSVLIFLNKHNII